MVLKLYLAGVPKVPKSRDEVEGGERLRAGGALFSPALSLSLTLPLSLSLTLSPPA